MDRRTLSRIDEELDSSEVAELCFLCSDVVNRRRLEGITDGKTLFMRLEEKGLLENSSFLCQLLQIIHRADLLNQLQNDCRQQEETDANPILSAYRVMLYDIYKDMTEENFEKIKFMLNSKLGRRQLEMSKTVLDVFVEMEKTGLMSQRDVTELHALLQDLDVQLAGRVERYTQASPPQIQHIPSGSFSIDQQRPNVASLAPLSSLSIQDNQSIYDLPVSASESLLPSSGEERSICTDALPKVESSSLSDEGDYYSLSHMPRGLCVIINNEVFPDTNLRKRQGTQEDEKALHSVFERLGFEVVTHRDLTAERIRVEMAKLGKRNFSSDDALVIAVLSHGDMGCIFGSDEKKVPLQDLTGPFKTGRAITLARKPKLFFIQACQGSEYQKGSQLRHPANKLDSEENPNPLEEDAGYIQPQTVPWDADFLIGMATVPECKSFRNISTGSIYIQELCRQLDRAARSSENDDILSVLTRVNREVSKGEFLNHKQMPEPKYTLTKKLVLKYVRP